MITINFHASPDNKTRQVPSVSENNAPSYYWRQAIHSPENVRDNSNPGRAQRRRHIGVATTLIVILSVGGYALVDDRANAATESEPTMMERYCRWNNGTYTVGAKMKTDDGSYQECFWDGAGSNTYWGEASRPRSRPSALM